jgi:hypothetical protein
LTLGLALAWRRQRPVTRCWRRCCSLVGLAVSLLLRIGVSGLRILWIADLQIVVYFGHARHMGGN